MKNKKLNAVHVWKQLEDFVVPRLHLSVHDRAVYSHHLGVLDNRAAERKKVPG